MATIPQTERRAACDGLLKVSGEDVAVAGRILHFLNTAFPGFTWPVILRERAVLWAPFSASGLSIEAYVDEVERQAGLIAYQE